MSETPEHLIKSYDQELKKLRNMMTQMGGIVETQVALAATVAIGSKLREPARHSDQDNVGMSATPEISFRRLGQSELPMLTRWLAEPHVRRFYQKSLVSPEDVNLEYGPAIRGEEPSSCHLAFCNGEPFAYLQCYRNRDYPDWLPDHRCG